WDSPRAYDNALATTSSGFVSNCQLLHVQSGRDSSLQPQPRSTRRRRSQGIWRRLRFSRRTDRSRAQVTSPRTAVIAVGGNALSPPGERSTIADQFRHSRESLGPIVDLVLDGWSVVIVHGNGPQVGDELVRNEKARSEVAPLPLGVLVA